MLNVAFRLFLSQIIWAFEWNLLILRLEKGYWIITPYPFNAITLNFCKQKLNK